jgi:hypothetical protein
MPVPPPRLGSTTDVPGAKSRCCLAVSTPLAHAVESRLFATGNCWQYRQAAWQQPLVHLRQSFSALQLQQTTAPSSPVAVTESSTHSSPHAHSKSQISLRSGAGGDGTARVVECLSGGVETLRSIAHIPFGPSVFPPLCSLYISRTHPHPARLPTALPIPRSGPIV